MSKRKFEDGVYNISNEEYHNSEGISRSILILMDKSPYHYWYEVHSGLAVKKVASDDMLLGSAFHTLLLEPQLFEKEYAVCPIIDKRTTVGKEIYAKFVQEHGHKTILSNEIYSKVQDMANSVKKQERVMSLINNSVYEKSIYWTDKETGLQFKVRPDIWDSKMCVDLKTAKDVSTNKFKYACLDRGYYLQAGMIYEACKAIGKPIEVFAHIAVEKTPPYAPKVFIMNDDALQYGIDQFHKFKRILAQCIESNAWESYPIEELGIAEFAVKQLEGDDNE